MNLVIPANPPGEERWEQSRNPSCLIKSWMDSPVKPGNDIFESPLEMRGFSAGTYAWANYPLLPAVPAEGFGAVAGDAPFDHVDNILGDIGGVVADALKMTR